MKFELHEKMLSEASAIISRYPKKRAALLPLLWLVQSKDGWISPNAADAIARLLEITPAEVIEVASFYTMFERREIGKHHIQVCAGVCCRLRGSDWLLNYLKEKLEIDVGQTSRDGLFSLSTVECLGSCGTAPMMQIGDEYYENLDANKVDEILRELVEQVSL